MFHKFQPWLALFKRRWNPAHINAVSELFRTEFFWIGTVMTWKLELFPKEPELFSELILCETTPIRSQVNWKIKGDNVVKKLLFQYLFLFFVFSQKNSKKLKKKSKKNKIKCSWIWALWAILWKLDQIEVRFVVSEQKREQVKNGQIRCRPTGSKYSLGNP